LGQRTHRELAHRVGRTAGRADVAADAANDDETAARSLEVSQAGVDRAQNAEHVGFELTTIVVERQALEMADDAEARVRDDDRNGAERLPRLGHRTDDVAGDGDIAGPRHDTGSDRLELAR